MGTSRRDLRHAQGADESVFPVTKASQGQGEQIGSPVVKVTIELPSERYTAVNLDVVPRASLISLRGADPRRGGGFGQVSRLARQCPCRVVRIRASERGRDIHI